MASNPILESGSDASADSTLGSTALSKQSPPLFHNWPTAKAGPQVPYEQRPDVNPRLGGLLLVVASHLVTSFPSLQSLLWSRAGFGTVKQIPGLETFSPRFAPVVIPIWDGVTARDVIPFSPNLLSPHPSDKPGRYNSVADYHEAFKSGAVTPVQVAEALLPLTRRGQQPPGKYATAWVDTYGDGDGLVLAAARRSTARWASGTPLGVLDGVPFAAKDDVDVKGFVTHNGLRYQPSEHFFHQREESESPVRALEEAGAIMVGKLAMHPLGCDVTGCNPVWGTPTNFHNPDYYPGGSSSGPASATCAGLVPICVATDAGGSLRIPAAFNGVYALKPSHGRIGNHPSSTMCVTGPMASTARDLTIAYRIMAQPSLEDDTPALFGRSNPSPPGAKKTIGVVKGWWARADDRVGTVCQKVVDHLSQRGYDVIEIEIPYLNEGQLAHGATCLSEMADKALTRTNSSANWLRIVPPAVRILMSLGRQTSAVDYIKYGQLRELLMQHMSHLFRQHPGLLVVSPTTSIDGWRRSPGDDVYGFSDGNTSIRAMRYVWLANSTGCPAVSVPAGYLDPAPRPGGCGGKLPVGLMAMAQWGAEEQLLEFALETEAYLDDVHDGGRIRPDGWADVIALAKQQGAGGDTNKPGFG